MGLWITFLHFGVWCIKFLSEQVFNAYSLLATSCVSVADCIQGISESFK